MTRFFWNRLHDNRLNYEDIFFTNIKKSFAGDSAASIFQDKLARPLASKTMMHGLVMKVSN